MGRKRRIEVEGGLYHVITRGNNRQAIFNSMMTIRKSSRSSKSRRAITVLSLRLLLDVQSRALVDRAEGGRDRPHHASSVDAKE